jgi:hypothetical protein
LETEGGGTFGSEEFAASLDILAFVHPATERPNELRRVAALVRDAGLEEALATLRAQHRTQQLLDAWIGAGTWQNKFGFLREHRNDLLDPFTIALLETIETPGARQHWAILQLIKDHDARAVETWVIDADAAAEAAFDAVDAANLSRLNLILTANPQAFQVSTRGTLLTIIMNYVHALGLPQIRQAQAFKQILAIAAQASSAIPHKDRRAGGIHLKRFAFAINPYLNDVQRTAVLALVSTYLSDE